MLFLFFCLYLSSFARCGFSSDRGLSTLNCWGRGTDVFSLCFTASPEEEAQPAPSCLRLGQDEATVLGVQYIELSLPFRSLLPSSCCMQSTLVMLSGPPLIARLAYAPVIREIVQLPVGAWRRRDARAAE